MIGDTGPYVEIDGPRIWVPRTVPYLQARRIAREAIQTYGNRLAYDGKGNAQLLGFHRDCRCDEVCEEEPLCPEVPVWRFRDVER